MDRFINTNGDSKESNIDVLLKTCYEKGDNKEKDSFKDITGGLMHHAG